MLRRLRPWPSRVATALLGLPTESAGSSPGSAGQQACISSTAATRNVARSSMAKSTRRNTATSFAGVWLLWVLDAVLFVEPNVELTEALRRLGSSVSHRFPVVIQRGDERRTSCRPVAGGVQHCAGVPPHRSAYSLGRRLNLGRHGPTLPEGLVCAQAGGTIAATYNDRDQTTAVNGEAIADGDLTQGERLAYGNTRFSNTILGLTHYTDGTTDTSVVREPNGQLTGLHRSAGADRRYPLTDALGSVVALTDAIGAQTDTYRYDPYGRVPESTGTTPNPFKFTGEHRDPSGTHKIGAGYYRSGLGQWTQPDPYGHVNPTDPQEGHSYAYVGNNPCNYTDLTGMAGVTDSCGASIGLLAISLGSEIAAVLKASKVVGLARGKAGLLSLVPGVGYVAAIESALDNCPEFEVPNA